MAQDLRGLVTGQFGVTFYVDSDAQPLVLSEDIRGALATYTTAERDAIDGRRLADNMLIYNSTTGQYERLVGGTRNASGFHTGGVWERFQTAGAAIDSDDSESRTNHTLAIRTGRGIDFNADSELQSIGGKAEVFHAIQERNENTTIVWTRGDLSLIEGDDYYTEINNGNTGVGRLNDNEVGVFGITQTDYNNIISSGRIAIDRLGARSLTISGGGGFVNNQSIVGLQPAGQARLTVSAGPITDYNTLPNNPSDLFYRTEVGQLFGGVYVFTPDIDQTGPTTNGNWQKLLEDQALRNTLRAETTFGLAGIMSIVDTDIANLAREISERDTEIAALSTRDTELNTLITNEQAAREAADTALNTRDTELNTLITGLRSDLDSEILRRERSDDSDADAIAAEVTNRILSDDSDALGIGTNRRRIRAIESGMHFRGGQYIGLSRTDSDSDTINVDTDAFRLAANMLAGFTNIETPGILDTDRIVISGNISTASTRGFTAIVDTDSDNPPITNPNSIGRRNGGIPSAGVTYDLIQESTIPINGEYLRDPVSNKILRITNDRPTQGGLFNTFFEPSSINTAASGAEVIQTPHGYHSYWFPDGGAAQGVVGGLSIVATNDLGFITLADSDRPDSDLPLNWRVVRGRWFDDAQYAVGQQFNGAPEGTANSPICTFNLFGDSDAKRNTPIGTLRDTEEQITVSYTPARGETVGLFGNTWSAAVVGGGSAAYPNLRAGTEFFHEIYDETFGATRAYVDGRLTETGITSLIGNTETLVTYTREMSSFPRPNTAAGRLANDGNLLPESTFVLGTGIWNELPSAFSEGVRSGSDLTGANSAPYRGLDLQSGASLEDATTLLLRGDSTVFRNVLLKMEEDSVVLFTDSDGTNKFYWEILERPHQFSFNENVFRIRRKNLKYATGTFDTESRYEIYLKPGVNDLLPGTQIIPESLQPLSLHLANNETLVDGQNVVIRRQGDTFLFAIEEGGGSGGSSGGLTRADLNNELNRLDLRYRDSDNGNTIDLFGNTTIASAEVAGTQARVSVTFDTDTTGTTIMTFAPPTGDSEQLTTTATTSTALASAVRDYFNDNVIGRTVATNAVLNGSTITWTFQGVGVTDSDTDTGFFYTNNASTYHTNNIVTQGTDMVPATYREGLIDSVRLPELLLEARVERSITPLGVAELPNSAAIVLTHSGTTDSEEIGFIPSSSVTWTPNLMAGHLTANVDSEWVEGQVGQVAWLRPDGPLATQFNDAMVFQNFDLDSDEARLIVHSGGAGGSLPAIGYLSSGRGDTDILRVSLPVKNSSHVSLADSDLWDGHTVRAHLSGGEGSIFTDVNNGLVPASGISNDSDFYLAGDATWRTVPRSRITFQDHEIDAYSDLFRIDYDADSETLTFSASAVDSEQSIDVNWDGNIAYIPSVSTPALALIGVHLATGPRYTLTDRGPVRSNVVDTEFAWRGSFTNFTVQEEFNRIIVRYADIDSDSDFGNAHIPRPFTDFILNSTMGELQSILPPTAPISSAIPIIASHFDSDSHGLVPASGNFDSDYANLGGDAVWRDGRLAFGSARADRDNEHEVAELRDETHTHILGRNWTADSDDIRPRDFRYINIDNAGVTIGTVHSNDDDAAYEGFVQGIIPSINHGGLWDLNMYLTYYDPSTNEFVHRRLDVTSTGANIRFDSDSDELFIGTPTNTEFGINVRARFLDANGNTLNIPAQGTITNGYWDKWVLYGDRGTSNQPVVSTETIRQFGDASFSYALQDTQPAIPVLVGANAERAVVGAGLTYSNGQLTASAAGDSDGVFISNEGVSVTFPVGRLNSINLDNTFTTEWNAANAGHVNIGSRVIPRRYSSSGNNFSGARVDEFVLDESTFSLYKVRNSFNLLNTNPPLDSEYYYVRLTGSNASHIFTPTELIAASQNPEQLVDYDTDGEVDWLQFRVTNRNRNAGVSELNDYTAIYTRDSQGRVTHIRIYNGITAGGSIASHSIVATRTYSFTANKTLWVDS